jgi:hypothetical protein
MKRACKRATSLSRPSGLALTCLLCPLDAHAHLIASGLGPVYDGIVHFVLTPQDLLPAAALALFAGLRGKAHARRVIFALPLVWLIAGFIGTLTVALPPMPLAWLPLVAVGGIVAADLPLGLGVTSAIALVLGAFLGYANGAAMAQAGPGLRAVTGIASTVFVTTTLVAASVAAWQSGWVRIAWRVAGSWIAATGLLLLGWSLVG